MTPDSGKLKKDPSYSGSKYTDSGSTSWEISLKCTSNQERDLSLREIEILDKLYDTIPGLVRVAKLEGLENALKNIDTWKKRLLLHNRLGLADFDCRYWDTQDLDLVIGHMDFFEKLVSAYEDATLPPSDYVYKLLRCALCVDFTLCGDRVTQVQDAMLKIASRFKSDTLSCFKIMGCEADPIDAAERLISIDRALKGHAPALIRAHENSIFSVYSDQWPFFQGIIHRLEKARRLDLCGDIFKLTRDARWSTDIAKAVLKLAETPYMVPGLRANAEAMMVESSIPESDKRLSPEMIKEITEICPITVHYMLSELQTTRFPWIEHFEFLRSVFATDIHHADEVIARLPLDEFRQKPEFFYHINSAWKGSTWGLLRAYQRDNRGESFFDFMNTHGIDVVAIRQNALSGSGKLFAHMPSELWSSLGRQYAEVFGPAAGGVYSRARRGGNAANSLIPEPEYLLECPVFRRNYDANAKERGIFHAERYMSLDKDHVVHSKMTVQNKNELYRLLIENYRSIDPHYQKDRALAVVVLATYDHNGAFVHSATKQFDVLSELGYKVVFCEASSGTEALDSVRRVVQQHRSVNGKVSKGAKYVSFLAHANGRMSRWGDPESKQPGDDLSAEHGDDLRLRDILSPDSPTINLFGCLLGNGGRGGDNFGAVMKHYNPEAIVNALAGCHSDDGFVSHTEEKGVSVSKSSMTRYGYPVWRLPPQMLKARP